MIVGFHRPEPETPEEFEARIRRRREEQAAATERRKKEDAERKARQEREREQGYKFSSYSSGI
jgi:hypothetical protein